MVLWLARAVLAYQDGVLVELYAYRSDDGHRMVEVVSQSGSKEGCWNEMAADLDAPAWYPGYFPAYLPGIMAVGRSGAAIGDVDRHSFSARHDGADALPCAGIDDLIVGETGHEFDCFLLHNPSDRVRTSDAISSLH